MFSTAGLLSTVWGVQYRGKYHDACGDIMSTMGVFSIVGDIIFCNLSTVGGYHHTCGGYHEYHGGVQYHGGTQITKDFPN